MAVKSVARHEVAEQLVEQLRKQPLQRSNTQANGIAPAAVTPSDSVDLHFKMCKKIAELTMVVHLLFKQNHENEIAARLLQDYYNAQMSDLQKKYEEQLRAIQEAARSMKDKQAEAEEKENAEKLKKQKEELASQVAELENLLNSERKKSKRLQENVAASAVETQDVRNQLAQAIAARELLIDKKNSELEHLKHILQNTERQNKELQLLNERQSASFAAKQHECRQQMDKLTELCDQQAKAKELLQLKNSQLNQELKHIRITMSQRLDTLRQVAQSSHFDDLNATEMDSLKNELLRYKMELQNREENYNRVFTQFNPIRVEKQNTKLAMDREQTQAASLLRLPTAANPLNKTADSGKSKKETEPVTSESEPTKTANSHRQAPATANAVRPSQAYGVDIIDLSKSKTFLMKAETRNANSAKVNMLPPPQRPPNVHLTNVKSLLSRNKTVSASLPVVNSNS